VNFAKSVPITRIIYELRVGQHVLFVLECSKSIWNDRINQLISLMAVPPLVFHTGALLISPNKQQRRVDVFVLSN